MTRLREWQGQGDWFQYQEHRLFFLDQGEGDTLLLIHGFPSASWDWHKLLPELSQHYRVVLMDLLGFGFSSKPHPHDYHIADQAQILEALLAHLGIQHCHLLAHDYGDTVAQELLARDPQRYLSCTFLNGGLFADAHRPLMIQKVLASPLGPLLVPFLGQRRFSASLRRIWGSHPLEDNEINTLWRLLSHNNGQRVIPALLHYMAERRQFSERWSRPLTHPPCPMMLIDGTQDPISGRSLVQAYRERVPESRIETLDGVGHYPQLEAPQQVLQHYLAFRNRIQTKESE